MREEGTSGLHSWKIEFPEDIPASTAHTVQDGKGDTQGAIRLKLS